MKKLIISAVVTALVFISCDNGGSSGGIPNSESPLENVFKTQGEVAQEKIKIGDVFYEKTREIVIVPQGKVKEIVMDDDNTDYKGKGVFLKGRKVKLSPYAMGAYEVTQDLYEAVTGINPSNYQGADKLPDGEEIQKLRPVECGKFVDYIVFCNELTKKTMKISDCVYYNDENKTTVYTNENAINKDTVYIDKTKKGYRLPTEAEWELAARGGDPEKKEWKYAYAGVQTEKEVFNTPDSESVLDEYAWYNANANSKTHEVGIKKKNSLGLYDMTGNVYEFCYDAYNENVEQYDEAFTVDGFVVNPAVDPVIDEYYRRQCIRRSGCWDSYANVCSVSRRDSESSCVRGTIDGFRLARSL